MQSASGSQGSSVHPGTFLVGIDWPMEEMRMICASSEQSLILLSAACSLSRDSVQFMLLEKEKSSQTSSWDGAEEHLLFGFEQISSARKADQRKVLEELNQLRALYLPVSFWYGNIIIPGNCLLKRCVLADTEA